MNKRTNDKWYFLTNQLNMKAFLAAGFIAREASSKYREDTLNLAKGWVPLFKNSVPAELSGFVTREKNYLRPVAVEIDLTALTGQAKAWKINGDMVEVELPCDMEENVVVVMVPDPVPGALIKWIIFQSDDEKKDFKARAKGFSDIPWQWFDYVTRKRVFKGKNALNIDESHLPQKTFKHDRHAKAVTSAYTLLFHVANLSDDAGRYYRWLREGCPSRAGADIPELLRSFPRRQNAELQYTGEDVRIFWNIFDSLIKNSSTAKNSSTSTSYDIIIQELEKETKRFEESKNAEALSDLISVLKRCRQLDSENLEDLIKKYPGGKIFSRALILFFCTDDITDFLRFQHFDKFHPHDYLAAAILKAACQTYEYLSSEVKCLKQLYDFCSCKVIESANNFIDTNIHINKKIDSPLPLREFLDSRFYTGANRKKIKQLMVDIARKFEIECITTTVTLQKGDYRMSLDGAGMHIVFPGVPRDIVSEADSQKFWDTILSDGLPLPRAIEDMARKRTIPANNKAIQ